MAELTKKARWFRPPPVARIVLAMALGIVAGSLLGDKVVGLGEVGKVLIAIIKALAGPLLFFAVLDAFLRTQIKAKSGALMIAVSLTNAVLAIAIGLFLSNVLQPGRFLKPPSEPSAAAAAAAAENLGKPREIRPSAAILDWLPTNLIVPFQTNSIISIVILAVIFGIALRYFKNEQILSNRHQYRVFEDLIGGLYRSLELILGWIVALLPLAVFAVIAEAVGKAGLAPLRGLALYVGVMALGLAVHVGLVYQGWVLLVLRMPLSRFWSGVREPVAFAAGASSSLATLPVTLASLRKMGVSDQSARMAACVGTNLNNDGILLYEAMAALFVAQVFGIHVSLGEQLVIAGLCVVASVGIAGVPEAGLISLSLVLATAKLPTTILPLLLSVDWILSRCRAMTNVVSDMLVAMVLDKLGNVNPPDLDVPTPIESRV